MIEYCLIIYLKCVDAKCIATSPAQEIAATIPLQRYPYRTKGSCEYAFRKYRHNPHYGHACWEKPRGVVLCSKHGG